MEKKNKIGNKTNEYILDNDDDEDYDDARWRRNVIEVVKKKRKKSNAHFFMVFMFHASSYHFVSMFIVAFVFISW